MAIKGATVDEIHGLADGMQDHAAHVELPSRALDIVGTGGDGYKTVNISTMSAIVLDRDGDSAGSSTATDASTSKSGSADVIEALGVNLDLDADALRRVFDEVGIAFLFANKMHPSMRFAAPVRRALGFPTAFNVLGPLTNPARVQACAIGASREENARSHGGRVRVARAERARIPWREHRPRRADDDRCESGVAGVGWSGCRNRVRCARIPGHGLLLD